MSHSQMDPPKADIMIVDDTRANLRLLSQMLGEQGYRVRPVPSGALALAAAHAEPPDLILLDIRMPEMDGYQVCERLKADTSTCGVPIIFYFSGVHEDYHGLADTADKIDYQKMEKVTRTIFAMMWRLANAPTRPKVDKPLSPQVAN